MGCCCACAVEPQHILRKHMGALCGATGKEGTMSVHDVKGTGWATAQCWGRCESPHCTLPAEILLHIIVHCKHEQDGPCGLYWPLASGRGTSCTYRRTAHACLARACKCCKQCCIQHASSINNSSPQCHAMQCNASSARQVVANQTRALPLAGSCAAQAHTDAAAATILDAIINSAAIALTVSCSDRAVCLCSSGHHPILHLPELLHPCRQVCLCLHHLAHNHTQQ